MVREHIRDRLLAAFYGREEVGHVRRRLAAVELFDGILGQRLLFELIDGRSFQLSPTDEERTLVALERDPVLGIMTYDDLGAAAVLARDQKLGGRVVAIGSVGVHGGAFDGARPAVFGADGPGGNVYMVGAPIRQLAA